MKKQRDVCYLNFTLSSPEEGGVDFQKKFNFFFFKITSSLTILVSFSNHHIKLNAIQNTYYKQMTLIFLKIRILFINKKLSLINFL